MGNTNSQEDGKRKGHSRKTSNLSIPKFVSKKSSLSISSTRSSSSRWTANENDSIKPSHGLVSRLKHGDTSFDDQSDLYLMYYSKRREEEREEMFEKFADNQIILYKPRSSLENENKPEDISSNLMDNTQSTTTQNKVIHNYTIESILSELYTLNDRSMERRRERDRRHRQHYLLKRIWGSNYKIPLKSPSVIVDWCCGTAAWGIELAFEFPTAKIIGIDHESATMSSLSNSIKNFYFSNAEIHKGENGLTDLQDNQVDYIIMRDVSFFNTPAIKWEYLFHDVMRILKPGGFIE
ncbi:hypothetical protein K501DRAFT_311519, partial [Backusella circina FSU 941]